MTIPEWKFKVDKELKTAITARMQGNEGMARVCARRAAGIVVGEYLTRKGYEVHTPSVITRLHFIQNLPELPIETREVVEHFLIHLDEEHKLPVDADLVAEARWLAKALLNEFN